MLLANVREENPKGEALAASSTMGMLGPHAHAVRVPPRLRALGRTAVKTASTSPVTESFRLRFDGVKRPTRAKS
jgi:hypothetical protein